MRSIHSLSIVRRVPIVVIYTSALSSLMTLQNGKKARREGRESGLEAGECRRMIGGWEGDEREMNERGLTYRR
jgi:hypothetical protein